MHLLRIAICEDHEAEMEQLIGLIQASLRAKTRPFDISRFHTGAALMSSYRPGQYDLLLIDMFLGDTLGIRIAEKIRANGDSCPLVFMTHSADYALEGFAVQASHYILKPITAEHIEEVWRRCLDAEAPQEDTITLMIDRKPRDIVLQQIVYIQADNKRCLIHTCDETLSTRMPIDQLEYMLSDPCFCRCHRGYIVNFNHVCQADKDFIMTNGDKVYIRQNETSQILQRYVDFADRNPPSSVKSP